MARIAAASAALLGATEGAIVSPAWSRQHKNHEQQSNAADVMHTQAASCRTT